MQPSSLIFLLLIAIWAVYLLQHWVRRREHLATARSVDRFSDAMHVLARRTSPPETDLSGGSPRSYDVSPARPSRPEVVPNRTQSLGPEVPASTESSAATVRPTRFFHVLAGMSARRLRGLSFLASVSLVLIVSLLAVFSVLQWWSVPLVVAVMVADVAWLHHLAVYGRDTGRIDQTPAEQGESTAGSAYRAARRPTYFEDEPVFGAEPEPKSVSRPVEAVLEAAAPVADPLVAGIPVFGVPVFGASALGAAEPEQPIEPPFVAGPSGWIPVPVPPPTYTLKARAVDRMVAAPAARSTAPVETGPWSLDGMVYDCDLDELVERRSATGT